MLSLVEIGLSNLLVAGLLALVALVISRTVRRPALSHGLWLLVLLKLITPPLVQIPIPWPGTVPPPEAQVAVAPVLPVQVVPLPEPAPPQPLPAPEDWPGLPEAPGEDEPVAPDIPAAPPLVEAVGAPTAPVKPGPEITAPIGIDWLGLLGLFWIGGSICWLCLALVRLKRFEQLLRHAPPAKEIQWEAEILARQLGLRHCPPVQLLSGALSPLLWSFLGPARLLIPAGLLQRLNPAQRAALLLHELAHYLRRDHWVRHLELVVLMLWWWCPLVWWVRRELHEAEEECCDAWVVWAQPAAAHDYATALLETVDFLSITPRVEPLAASGLGRLSLLKRRLTMIMSGSRSRTLTWGGGLTLLAVGVLLLPLVPIWAQDERPKRPQPGAQEQQPKDDKDPERREQLKKIEAEIRELHEKMQEQHRNMEKRMRELMETRRKLFPGAGERPGERPQPPEGRPGERPVPPRPPQPPFAGGERGDLPRRLAEVERKLDELLREIRQLRSQGPGLKGPARPGEPREPQPRPEPRPERRDGARPGAERPQSNTPRREEAQP